jgi:hypothetical protein
MSDVREECAAHISALTGATADSDARRHHRDIRNAAATASHCAKCGRALAPGEPVWRFRMTHYALFGWSHTVAPLCEQCKGGRWYRGAKECEGCGRPVHNQMDRVQRGRTLCSSACRIKAVSAAARSYRRHARGTKVCDSCAETFEPSRTDARFCSIACKQRAYRKRVTSSECRADTRFDSRNGAQVGNHVPPTSRNASRSARCAPLKNRNGGCSA